MSIIKKLILCRVITVALIGLFSTGCSNPNQPNTLSQWGFPVSNSSVVIHETPSNLKGEEAYVKANLTMAQAKALRKAFLSQPGSERPHLDSRKVLQSRLVNPQWKPMLVKKSWEGGFEKKELNSVFHCQYIFDVSNPKKIDLYFYAITFDD